MADDALHLGVTAEALRAYQQSLAAYTDGATDQELALLGHYIARANPLKAFLDKATAEGSNYSARDHSVDVPTGPLGGGSADAMERYQPQPGDGVRAHGRERIQPLPPWGQLIDWGKAQGLDVPARRPPTQAVAAPVAPGVQQPKTDPAVAGLAAHLFQQLKGAQPATNGQRVKAL